MSLIESTLEWAEIAYMAVICLWQEARGQEPDCPACWKCEAMRATVLSVAAFTLTLIVKAVLS